MKESFSEDKSKLQSLSKEVDSLKQQLSEKNLEHQKLKSMLQELTSESESQKKVMESKIKDIIA